jgi:hypothetical protein
VAVAALDYVTRVPVALLGDRPHAANVAIPGMARFHTHFLPAYLSALGLIVDVLVYASYSATCPTTSFRVCGVECMAAFPADHRRAVAGRGQGPPLSFRRVRGRQ